MKHNNRRHIRNGSRNRYAALGLLLLFITAVGWYRSRHNYTAEAQRAQEFVTGQLQRSGIEPGALQEYRRETIPALTYGGRRFFSSYKLKNPENFDRVLQAFQQTQPPPPLNIASYRTRQTDTGRTGIIDIHSGTVLVFRLTLHAPLSRIAAPAPAPPVRPRMAVVLDDWGYSRSLLEQALTLPVPVTHAILPNLAYSRELAAAFTAAHKEIILHQPMEPQNGNSSEWEKNTLTEEMPENEIKSILRANIDQLPGLRGVNNHMGSKATENPYLLRVVLQELRTRKLFFLDSLTSAESVVGQAAAEAGVRCLKRDVFIDNTDSPETITKQLKKAATIARRNGTAIAIGHARPATLAVLQRTLPQLEKEGIEFVPVSALLSGETAQ